MLTEPDKRLLMKFAYNFGWKGMRAVDKFKKRIRQGRHFPAFLFISITNRCNLSCQGCWSTMTDPPLDIDPNTLRNVINTCRKQGSYFFGILGGEPLLYKGILDILAEFPDCYFILFTNGTLISAEVAARIRRIGNISPLISIEGLEQVSDERRGSHDVLKRTMDGLRECRRQRLIIGVATSICKSNIKDLASEEFVQRMTDDGALYLWYYIYRPVGPNPNPGLALSKKEICDLRQFIVDIRTRAPIMIIDAYWDHDGNGLCPAAVGIGHHINPAGFVEPCPPIQFAVDNVTTSLDISETIGNSKFMAHFRDTMCKNTNGCVLLEKPELLSSFLQSEKAVDTSGRNTAFAELDNMSPMCSHSCAVIPEKSFFYRFAKKNWFFGFGAYG